MERPTGADEDAFTRAAREANGSDPGYDWGAPPPPPRGGVDLAGLFVMLDAVRRTVPAELQDRFNALIREVLLTLRSLIDWYLERLDRPQRGPQVEDIPLD